MLQYFKPNFNKPRNLKTYTTMINVLNELLKEAEDSNAVWAVFSVHVNYDKAVCVKLTNLPKPLNNDDCYYIIFSDYEALVVKWDYNKGLVDELIDETSFNDEEPLWFTSYSHRVSPVYHLRILIKTLEKALGVLYPPSIVNVKGILLTNSNLINYEDCKNGYEKLAGVVIKDNLTDMANRSLPTSAKADLHSVEYALRYLNINIPKTQVPELKIEDDELDYEVVKVLPNDIIDEEDLDSESENESSKSISSEEERQAIREYEHSQNEIFPYDDGHIHSVKELVELLGYTPETLKKTETVTTTDGKELTVNREVSLPNVDIFRPLDDPKQVLDGMIGLDSIKEKLHELSFFFQYNVMKTAYTKTKIHSVNLHSTYIGNPGTGKTTMARIWSSLLNKYDQLSTGHLVVATRSSFLGKTWGSEEEALRRILDISKGGTLLIDEAYSLVSNHAQDPGRNVLPLLLPLLADESTRDISVILAGYPAEMNALLKSNPGITSRFNNNFEFKDFTFDQLCDISQYKVKQYRYNFTPAAWKKYYWCPIKLF